MASSPYHIRGIMLYQTVVGKYVETTIGFNSIRDLRRELSLILTKLETTLNSDIEFTIDVKKCELIISMPKHRKISEVID